ncbi:MAG: PadR family transcriptional regulator [bacterium]|nr:PadR family transcriptional regulator [bacterium]
MARKARTHYAILGLICWKPMSGYDIKKLVEVGLRYFWSESYGQIFPTLNRLVDDGLATRRIDPKSGGRRRQVYAATGAGRRVFKEWLRQPTDLPRLRDELKLKFFLTSRSESGEGVRLLEEYREQQLEHLAILKESQVILASALQDTGMPEELHELQKTLDWRDSDMTDEQSHELLVFYLTLRSGILVAEARVAWVEEVLPILQTGQLPETS